MVRLGNSEVLKTLTKTLTFVDADANANANADAGDSTIALRERCSGELKKDFQDGHLGNHLGLRIVTILVIFDLQVTTLLPTKFQVNWPLGSGEEAKNRISRRPRPSWFL